MIWAITVLALLLMGANTYYNYMLSELRRNHLTLVVRHRALEKESRDNETMFRRRVERLEQHIEGRARTNKPPWLQ